MNLGLVIFIVVLLAALGGVAYVRRMGRKSAAAVGGEDMTMALSAFSQSYPDATVRDVVQTKDGASAFLRLADGRTGLVRMTHPNVAVTIVTLNDVQVETSEQDRTLRLHAAHDAIANGVYAFGSEAETAEVSLWLASGLIPPPADSQ